MSFDLAHAEIAFSNLGGHGPDTDKPPGIRYVNVAKVQTPDGRTLYQDLYVEAVDSYTPFEPQRNGLSGRFAQINFLANSCSRLRVSVRPSCAQADSCARCDDTALHPTAAARKVCYSAGCSCYAQTVYAESDCSGFIKDLRRQLYECDGMDASMKFPAGSRISFSVYDLNTGPSGEYVEELTISGYEYYVTPLRPASGNEITSTIAVDRGAGTFTSSARGTSADRPTDPASLTDYQASTAVQFFFASRDGSLEAKFCVRYTSGGGGSVSGTDILFAGSSARCASAAAVPSSKRDAFAISIPVKSITIC